MIFGKCAECGKEMQAQYQSHLKTYCSAKCAGIGRWKTSRKRAESITFKCQHCSSDFDVPKSQVQARIKKGTPPMYCSRKCSQLAHRNRKEIECENCGTMFEVAVGRDTKFCSQSCAQEFIKESGIRKRRGYWMENGYRVLYTEDGRGIKEHIKVMQDHIGRELRPDEVVHHINENRTDNRLENLRLMTRGEHSRLHRQLELEAGKKLFQ